MKNEKMKLLVAIPDCPVRHDFLAPDTVKLLEENFEVSYNELGRNYTKEELLAACEGIDVVVTGWGTPGFIGSPPPSNTSLKLIAHTAGSVGDLLDGAVYDRGIRVISGNTYFAESVAEGTIAYITAMLRRIPDEVYGMKGGILWHHPSVPVTRGLLDREIGIIGYGMISKYLMQMLKVFRCKIKIFSHHEMDADFLRSVNAESATLDEVFRCDIVSLHSTLTEETLGMIGREHFDLMPEGAIFINTARGAIIRENEMIEALNERNIYAVLDVYENEPLDINSPLRSMDNVYLLPHRGGPTVDRRSYIGKRVIEDVVRFKRGEELTLEISREYAARMTKMGAAKKK